MNFTGSQTNARLSTADAADSKLGRTQSKFGQAEFPHRAAGGAERSPATALDRQRPIARNQWSQHAPSNIPPATPRLRPSLGARSSVDHQAPAGVGAATQSESDDSEDRSEGVGTIILIDPRVLFRDCLAHCLRQSYLHRRVMAYASVAEWMAKCGDEPPAVVLFSTPRAGSLRSESPVETAFLNKIGADIPVIIISESDDTSRILHALKNGARGYIPTSLALAVAVEAVRLVDAGGTFVPVSTLLESRRAAAENGYDLFTPRQIMVMEALHRGKANKQIALELNMRESTVKVHIRHIMKKLNARNRTEVAVLTSELFEPPPDATNGHAALD